VPSIKNDFFSAVISGVEEIAYGREFNTVVCQSNESSEREAIHLRTLISNRVAGVLVSVAQTTTSGEGFQTLQRQGIPLVFFDRVCEDVEAGRVVVDDYGGAMRLVEHLIQRGYRNIAHVAGPENTSIGRDRCRGYLDALKKHGLNGTGASHHPWRFRGRRRRGRPSTDSRARTDAGRDLRRQRPGGSRRPRRDQADRLEIPRDVAVAGFGDNRLSSYLDPPLTTVSQSPYEIGKIAAAMLLRRIDDPSHEPVCETEVIQTHLIVREST
jgi:LacI family transcriptional regulator